MKINEHLYQQISTALNFIEAHLKEEINLEDIAQSAHISLFHFSRVFQFMTQISPYDYLIRRRIHEAGYELIHSKKKIIEIAFEYAFASPEVFNRAFKRVYNIQASQYRKNNLYIPYLYCFKPEYMTLIHENITSPIQKIYSEDMKVNLQLLDYQFSIGDIVQFQSVFDQVTMNEQVLIFDYPNLKGLWKASVNHTDKQNEDQLFMHLSVKEHLYFIIKGNAKQLGLAIAYIQQIYAPKNNIKLGAYIKINKNSNDQEWEMQIPTISITHSSGED